MFWWGFTRVGSTLGVSESETIDSTLSRPVRKIERILDKVTELICKATAAADDFDDDEEDI